MKKQSAGILLFRQTSGHPEVLLAHPGGPFWKNKDFGSWSIPKGEFDDPETPVSAALREFEEETGFKPQGGLTELNAVKMKSGKIIYAYAIEGDFDLARFKSNDFEMEWPPKSGKMQSFPEIDRIKWFTIEEALVRINETQSSFVIQLQSILSIN